jgi:HK97 family phage prohead protease
MLEHYVRQAALEVDGDGRTLTGYAVPYGVPAEVDDGDGPYLEAFDRGAFRHVVKAPRVVELRYPHGRDLDGWVGKTLELVERDRGLWGRWRLDDPDEHPAAALVGYKVRDGQLPGLSVSFTPGATRELRRDGRLVRVRQTVKVLHHVALVPDPAYAPVEPLAVRSSSSTPGAERARSWRASWQEWRDALTLPPGKPTP